MRKLRSFEVREECLQMFYTATVSSAFTFEMPCVGMHPNKTKTDSTGTPRRQVGWWGEGKKAKDLVYHRLVTNRVDGTYQEKCAHLYGDT